MQVAWRVVGCPETVHKTGFDEPLAASRCKNGALRMRMSAKERVFNDPDNGAAEFKLRMGTAYAKQFSRLNRSLKQEELSAEILKSLKDDARDG